MYRLKTKKQWTIGSRKSTCTVTQKSIQRKVLCFWFDIQTYEIEKWKDNEIV